MKPGVKPSFITRRKKLMCVIIRYNLCHRYRATARSVSVFRFNRDCSPTQVVTCLGLPPYSCLISLWSWNCLSGLPSRQGDRCPQETNVPRPTSLDTVTFCDTNHIFLGSYQKVSFESDDNFGCRLMHADGMPQMEACLTSTGKNTCIFQLMWFPGETP